MTVLDGVLVFALFVLLIYLDKAKEWLFEHTGTANILTRIIVGTVEILLDLGLIAAVGGWIFKDIKCTFRAL